MLSRGVVGFVLGVLVALIPIGPAVAGPAVGDRTATTNRVVVIGAAGLRWDDLSPSVSPALWQLAGRGSIGTVTARSTQSLTCAEDGWLTLGAGSRAQRGPHRPAPDRCPRARVQLTSHEDGSANLSDQPAVVARNLLARSRPGALAEALRCTTAIGPGAAIAAARPAGRINQYLPQLPSAPATLLDRCPLSVVDAGTVTQRSGYARSAQVRSVDQMVARVLDARPAGSTVLVLGVADTGRPARLHVAIAEGSGFQGGWLRSGTTRRTGYVQLTDVAPTVIACLGLPRPASFAGRDWEPTGRRSVHLATDERRLVLADRMSVATARNAGRFVAVLVAVQLALFVLAGFGLARLGTHSGVGQQRRRGDSWLRPVLETAATAAAVLVPAMLLADLIPWWRSERPGSTLVGVVAGWVAVLTTVILTGPWRRYRLGRVAAIAGVVVAVIGVDALTGANLELDNVVGYAVVTGDRYTGLGMVGLGAFAAGVLALAGCAATRLARRHRPVAVALVGAIGVIIVGSPYLGSDPGAAVAVTAGVAVAGALATGGWLTLTRLGWAIVTGLLVTVGFALLDLTRAPERQGHLGRFLTNIFGGTARPAMSRVAEANMAATAGSLLTVLVVAAILFWGLVLLSGGLRRVYGLFPALRGALVGTAVAGLLAGLFDGAGLIVAGAAASVAVPLAILYCLQVRARTPDVVPAGVGSGVSGGLTSDLT